MQYKTIALGLIQEDPRRYETLRGRKMLLTAMEAYAIELRAMHQAWKERLDRTMPGGDPARTAAEALELATQELRDRLHTASPPGEADSPPPDAATNHARRHSPPA